MSRETEMLRHNDRGGRCLAGFLSLTVGLGFLALWFRLLPSWLDFRREVAGVVPWRWLAAMPCVSGFTVALRCVWDFGWTGRGTPAPVAPPKRLVVTGFYRYVRNPMYIGFLTGWLGLWIIFGHANRSSLTIAVVFLLCVVLFVHLYEEPTLRRMFGADYDQYCRNVPRWIPRLHPWTQAR